MQDIKQQEESTLSWSERFDKLCTGKSGNMTWAIDNSKMKDFISKELELERQKAKEETLVMVLKEIEGMIQTEDNNVAYYLDYERNKGFNQALDTLKERLKAKQ